MYKWEDINTKWVNNNKKLLYEYYAHIQTIQPLSINEYKILFDELKNFKAVIISYRGISDTILDSTFDDYDNQHVYFKRTLKEFNRYCLRKKNLNILLNA